MRESTLKKAKEHTRMTENKGRFEEFGRKVDERVSNFVPRIEDEVRKVIAYLNDEVVPKVRQNSSEAMHAAAEQLRKLADSLDRR
jgi:hypothetical protein